MKRPRIALALVLSACGGAPVKDPAPPTDPAPDRADAPPVERPPAAAATPECLGAYGGYVRAWGNWFEAELGDADTAAEIVAEFGQELPSRAALAEMREVADGLRYEAGFDLWFTALTATERAIETCGEGAARPRTAAVSSGTGAAGMQ